MKNSEETVKLMKIVLQGCNPRWRGLGKCTRLIERKWFRRKWRYFTWNILCITSSTWKRIIMSFI